MSRPFRRYSFHLAERLGYSKPEELYKVLDSNEISEWMAFDRTMNPEWLKEYNDQAEKEEILSKSLEEQSELVKKLLGGVNG